MTETINNYWISDPKDLKYISDVVNQVLDNKNELADIKDLQAALKSVSLEHGKEIQINLVFEENELTGFNFSFKNDPTITTDLIPFKQQQINVESENGDIIPHTQPTSTIDIAATKSESIASHSPSPNEIILTPGLQVEGQRIINPDDSEIEETLKSPFSRYGQLNPGLRNVANQLASRSEIDGLLLTGLTLKTALPLTEIQTEDKPDVQTAGLAVIKRFQQVLPQEFIDLKAGNSPKDFNWKDPQSNKQYQFCFKAAQTNVEGDILIPASLKGFEKIPGSDSMHPVFAATLIDAKYNRWSIEQCDFDKSQIQSLNFAARPTPPNHSTALTNAVGDFLGEM